MQLNKEQLRHERERRAWSQSHLAEVASLSMRTVQRIETTGLASLESAKAIAAAFDTQVEALLATQTIASTKSSTLKKVTLLAAILSSAIVGFSWWSHALADQVMVDVAISADDKSLASAHLLSEVGEPSEMKVNDLLKVKVTSTKVEGSIFVDAQVYFFNGKTFELTANPKLLVANKQSAAVSITGLDGKTFHFIFTPQL